MVQMKNYITLQVIVLCIFRLSADDKAQKVIKKGAEIPRVVEGSGKIIDVSKRSPLKKDEDKNMNELLYEIYNKFKKDTAGMGPTQHKREMNVVSSPEKKAEDYAKADNKGEDHKLVLRELETTIDKLIGSLTKVTNDGKFEDKDITDGIKDLSKFADLSNVNTPTKDTVEEKKDAGTESFDDFKEKFYKTFIPHNDNEKRQKIVYHGKKSVSALGGEIIETNEGIIDTKDSKKKSLDAQLNSKRLEQLANLYEQLKKETSDVTKSKNIQKLDQYRKKKHDENVKRSKVDTLRKDLLSLVGLLDNMNKKKNAGEKKRDALAPRIAQVKRREMKKDTNIETLKNDLVSLFDIINKKKASSGRNSQFSPMKDEQKDATKNVDVSSTMSDLDNITPHAKLSQDQLKRNILSVVQSLETELTSGNENYAPPNRKKDANQFDKDLDNIVSPAKPANNGYTMDEFFEALKGFKPKVSNGANRLG